VLIGEARCTNLMLHASVSHARVPVPRQSPLLYVRKRLSVSSLYCTPLHSSRRGTPDASRLQRIFRCLRLPQRRQ
jgi:hypothetical protein